MKRTDALALALFFASSARCAEAERDFVFAADLTYASKYMTDGFKVGGDHPVIEPSFSIRSGFAPGFSLLFWSALQTNRENQGFDELDAQLRYARAVFVGSAYALELHGFYDYWLYPRADTATHGSKLNAGVSLPELLPIAGAFLVPSYNAYYWIYWAESGRYLGGARHELELRYFHSTPSPIPGTQASYAGIAAALSYHDGAFGVNPDWSHATAQFAMGTRAFDFDFALSLNRQWSFLAALDPSDEVWSTFSVTREF